jgi:solute carrier family 25 uncoupling protein 8/9
MAGLWKGLGPNIARNAIINAAELASYDQIKVSLLATGRAGHWLDGERGQGHVSLIFSSQCHV